MSPVDNVVRTPSSCTLISAGGNDVDAPGVEGVFYEVTYVPVFIGFLGQDHARNSLDRHGRRVRNFRALMYVVVHVRFLGGAGSAGKAWGDALPLVQDDG